MLRDRLAARKLITLTGVALSAAGAFTILNQYVSHEMKNRGYPAWKQCRCDFKAQHTVLLIYRSRHKQQGETFISQEWSIPLYNLPVWLRRTLHHCAQVIAIFNPTRRYVERALLVPQEAQQFALKPRPITDDEEGTVMEQQTGAYIIWRREVLHVPHHFFDVYIRRLYPAYISDEQQAQALPVLWDVASDMPLPLEGTLLDTPLGTKFDYIGWTPSQTSYCTARITQPA
ncbi:MAG TPA: hypothetical protein VH593_24145 [Ktedonobacteraceae bacterium]|jgi:hypothetical protein